MKFHYSIAVLFSILSSLLCGQAFSQGFTKASGSALAGLGLSGEKDGGFAFGDFNQDGYLDLLVNTIQDDPQHRTRLFFYNPSTATFEDVTESNCKGCIAGDLPGRSFMERQALIADFNNDGYPDFLRNNSARIEIYLNNGPASGFTFGLGSNQTPNQFFFHPQPRIAFQPERYSRGDEYGRYWGNGF